MQEAAKVAGSRGKRLGGRGPGTPNRVTAEFRETVQKLLDDNRDNVAAWLAAVAKGDQAHNVKPDPGKALDLMARLAEFAAPKLGRIEHTGDGGGPVVIRASSADERL